MEKTICERTRDLIYELDDALDDWAWLDYADEIEWAVWKWETLYEDHRASR
jgi:hypothetical protein